MKITNADVAEALGGLPPNKLHCSNLGADALHSAIKNYLDRKSGKVSWTLEVDKEPHHKQEAGRLLLPLLREPRWRKSPPSASSAARISPMNTTTKPVREIRMLTMGVIYLDHLAATPLHPRVKEAMIHHIETVFGNPSTDNQVGQPAADALEKARAQVAALINADPKEVVFNSGGTESVNHAIKGVAIGLREKGRHIITSNIEHKSVLNSLRTLRLLDYRVTSLDVDQVRPGGPRGGGEGHHARDHSHQHHAGQQRDRHHRAHRRHRQDRHRNTRWSCTPTRWPPPASSRWTSRSWG